ncbi:uncharacterized protein EAF01_008980 [Botrytis porri]|uniref:Uncharacterized protein n=1 Tax=Botrytis porri TaxID=87229 RepID=A0A4Z1L0J9_9HELO|nr:uncharacterized protein EAF01_008980 [Botrytis porri]KAF7898014.1 hypothetical protein EAF01_008980 [Botrytis porri]TGO90241.1 hypothetical protein BPOR_0073g00160 [Botrytis porri]
MAKRLSKSSTSSQTRRRSIRILTKRYIPQQPLRQPGPTNCNTLPREVQMIIVGKVANETPRRLVLNQELTQLWTILRINSTSRAVTLLNYRLLFEGNCPFRPEKHYMFFNPDIDTLCILDWSILRSCWRWDIDLDLSSIKHVECETKDYTYVLILFDHLDTIKVHWPILCTNFGRAYPELEVKMRDLKDDIEQWVEEWHPERRKPEVEVVLFAERIESYKRKIPVLMIPSNSEYNLIY